MNTFIFEDYGYDKTTKKAYFRYSFEDGRSFEESYTFDNTHESYDEEILQRALRLAHLVIGTSYYKTFPSPEVLIKNDTIDGWQAMFLSNVYQEGLSQYAFENNLTRDDLAHFMGTGDAELAVSYAGSGVLSLQSGGKDSLLTASMLHESGVTFTSLYVANGPTHPSLIDELGEVFIVDRAIDRPALKQAADDGAKNGHIPITYVIMSIALVQAILTNKGSVLTSIGHEGEEPHAQIGDLSVTHQWSKTWPAEQHFAEYVQRYISKDLRIGSPLRRYSELRVAELFAEKAWAKYGHEFSSCNRINYKQGNDNSTLKWCGECSKCANSYLLFAPFIEPDDLKSLFNGQDLFVKPLLTETFKGLLGIDGVPKPFECIGEIDELRLAYHKKLPGYENVPFDVPQSSFDYMHEYPVQEWVESIIT
jgi:hypothetical protein